MIFISFRLLLHRLFLVYRVELHSVAYEALLSLAQPAFPASRPTTTFLCSVFLMVFPLLPGGGLSPSVLLTFGAG